MIMKRTLIVLTLLVIYLTPKAQTITRNMKIEEIADRMAIKELVDTFSILADQKDIAKQVLLFTENGTVTSKMNGQAGAPLVGRKQIGDVFTTFLNTFEVVYHVNGQQTITLNGNNATGISYCAVTLIGVENGKRMKTSMGVYYNDEYVRENGHWLIAKRTSNFTWQDKQPMAQ
jgi:hypothetical protein